jgi:hypothetical protein
MFEGLFLKGVEIGRGRPPCLPVLCWGLPTIIMGTGNILVGLVVNGAGVAGYFFRGGNIGVSNLGRVGN